MMLTRSFAHYSHNRLMNNTLRERPKFPTVWGNFSIYLQIQHIQSNSIKDSTFNLAFSKASSMYTENAFVQKSSGYNKLNNLIQFIINIKYWVIFWFNDIVPLLTIIVYICFSYLNNDSLLSLKCSFPNKHPLSQSLRSGFVGFTDYSCLSEHLSTANICIKSI